MLSREEVKSSANKLVDVVCHLPGINSKSVSFLIVDIQCCPLIERARKLIENGGLHINSKKVESIDEKWSHETHVIRDYISVVKIG